MRQFWPQFHFLSQVQKPLRLHFFFVSKILFRRRPENNIFEKKSVVIEKVKFVAEIVITAAARRFQHCFVLELGKDSTLAV